MQDTICAIATSLGVGAISIIRVSGMESIKIVNEIFKGKNLCKAKSHTIHYGYIIENEEKVDEVLVSIFRAPKTYTTEDIVEINCHGGISTTNKVLELLITKGCRLAEGGEFTKRAFLNGRIDLIQAEAVGDLINSTSETSRALSLNQVTGSLSEIIKELRKKIVELLANIEVNIDYPEYEDAENITLNILETKLKNIKKEIEKVLSTANSGKIIKDGVNVALVGRPNVGKSSLLNRLIDEKKAIVTDIAGTTRDVVEGTISISGVKFNFIDTAGIRKTDDIVEKIGVEKSKKIIKNADIIICLLNGSEDLTEEDNELLNYIKEYKNIIYINKNDKKLRFTIENAVYGNTITLDGIDKLKEKLLQEFNLDRIKTKDFTYISNARQIGLLNQCLSIINDSLTQIENNIPVDIIEIDIKRIYDTLGEIIGQTYKDELLDELFSNFCLGK